MQIGASLIRIGRDASERSISPLQNRWKPPPVPEMPTVTCTPVAPARRKSSAAAVVYGPTVDEPSAVIEPLSFFRLYVGPAVEPAIAVDATTVASDYPRGHRDAAASRI